MVRFPFTPSIKNLNVRINRNQNKILIFKSGRVATFLSHNWGNVFHHTICQDITRSMLDATPAHTSLVHHFSFIFLNISLPRDLTRPRLMFFPRSSIDIVIVISGFCQEMEPRYSRDCEARLAQIEM